MLPGVADGGLHLQDYGQTDIMSHFTPAVMLLLASHAPRLPFPQVHRQSPFAFSGHSSTQLAQEEAKWAFDAFRQYPPSRPVIQIL